MKNRFAGRLQPQTERRAQSAQLPAPPVEVVKQVEPQPQPLEDDQPKKIGRPGGKGKSSNPDFVQATLYLRRATYNKLKIAAIHGDKELSDLAEEILTNHLSSDSLKG